MSDLMLSIINVSKEYKLGEIGGTTLRDELQRFSAKIHRKEDPTKKIGSKTFEKGETFMALSGVSFDVQQGERIGIIGHNGAGKSTLLKLISRVTAPTSGMIGINGRVASMLEVGTGFHPELTGRENVYMNGAILGMTKKEIDSKMDDIIEFSECRRFIDTPVKRYSSGMYVKLAFSVAAHLDSEIMIMDEVLAVGDMKFQEKCLGKMNSVSTSDGRTILYVSHNMQTIRQLCDRCIVLDHGEIAYDGDVEKAICAYEKRGTDVILNNYLSEKPRKLVASNYFRFSNIEYLGTNERILYGDKLKFLIQYECKRKVRGIYFRFEIYAADGTVPGIMFSSESVNCESECNEYETIIEVNTNHLVPGWYRFDLVAYLVNSFGVSEMIDRIEKAVQFEIIKKTFGDIEWVTQYWGHTKFEDISIIRS